VIWVRFSLQAFRDDEARIMRYEGRWRTSRPAGRRRRRLPASEERFRALVQNASDLIAILEQSGAVRYESPRISACSPLSRRVPGQRVPRLVHPEDRPEVAAALPPL